MRTFFITFCFSLLLFSCSEKSRTTPEPDIDAFFRVYLTFIELNQADSLALTDKSVLMDSAIAIHGMDQTAFDSTLAYLEKHPDIFLEAFEKFDAEMRAKSSNPQ